MGTLWEGEEYHNHKKLVPKIKIVKVFLLKKYIRTFFLKMDDE